MRQFTSEAAPKVANGRDAASDQGSIPFLEIRKFCSVLMRRAVFKLGFHRGAVTKSSVLPVFFLQPPRFEKIGDQQQSSSRGCGSVFRGMIAQVRKSQRTAVLVPEVTKQQIAKRKLHPWAKYLYLLLYVVAAAVSFGWFQLWRNS